MVTVIFPAAGVGRRMGAGKNKALLDLCGKPVLVRTLLRFSECDKVDDFIVAVGAEEVGEVSRMLEKTQGLKPFRVVAGGAERQYSVQNALAALSPDTEIVLVHDAARPLVTVKTIEAVVAEAWRSGAGIAAVRAKNTIKIVRGDGVVESTPDRARLWEVQTPQGFRRDVLEEAYRRAEQEDYLGTDDSALVERLGLTVRVVEGDDRNIKLTTPEDLWTAEMFFGRDALGVAKERVASAGAEFGEILDELADKVSDAADAVSAKVEEYKEKREGKK